MIAVATPLQTPATPAAPNVTVILPTQLLVEWSHRVDNGNGSNGGDPLEIDQYRVLLNAGQKDYKLFGVG